MYFKFYGLNEKPFSLSADPRYLYNSQSHREALSQMIYAASEDSGFLILTGEVGTGKTIMINALIERLPSEYRVAKIYHTALNPKGLIQNICKEFNIDYIGKPTSQLILDIQDFLRWTYNAGEHSVLILDEAQDLDRDTLEEVRLLSNFEANHKKILQIFLVGQPELEKKLANQDLRQFRERVSLRYRLKKLSPQETYNYITHRLAVAGRRNNKGIFSKQAIEKIYEYSRGIPRRINILAENALLMGYAESKSPIDSVIIEKISNYHPAEDSFTDIVERELNLPTFSTPVMKQSTTTQTANPFRPPVSNEPVSGAPVKEVKKVSEVKPAARGLFDPTPPMGREKLTQTPRKGGNGTFDYKQFQTYMTDYLMANDLELKKKSSTGDLFLKAVLGIVLLIISFLIAFYIASATGIIQ